MRILILLLSLTILTGCLKEREIEKLKDPDREWINKTSFIEGKKAWLYKVTVVKTSPNSPFLFKGIQSDLKAARFEFSKSKLRLLNINMPYDKLTDSTTEEVLNEWDITHHDVKLSESNGQATNKEEEDKNKTWDQKKHFKVDFSKAKMNETTTFPYYMDMAFLDFWIPASTYLVDNSLDVSSDYISFVVGVDYQQLPLANTDKRREVRKLYLSLQIFLFQNL